MAGGVLQVVVLNTYFVQCVGCSGESTSAFEGGCETVMETHVHGKELPNMTARHSEGEGRLPLSNEHALSMGMSYLGFESLCNLPTVIPFVPSTRVRRVLSNSCAFKSRFSQSNKALRHLSGS